MIYLPTIWLSSIVWSRPGDAGCLSTPTFELVAAYRRCRRSRWVALPWVFSRLDYADGQTEKDTAQL